MKKVSLILVGLLNLAIANVFADDNESPVAQAEVKSPVVAGMPVYSKRVDMVQNMPNVVLFSLYDNKPYTNFATLLQINAGYLVNHRESKVKIVGYADDYQSSEKNQELGLQRAQMVRNILTSMGVDYDDTVVVSVGDTKPFVKSKPGEYNQHNRRVEIYYIADEPKGYHFDKVPVIKIDSFVETDVPMPIN